jgi:SNF2 family DNA or RNA helicase
MKLYDYQEQGVQFLAARSRAYLADVPGLGKTAQAIMAARLIRARHIMVVCPASAVAVWYDEIRKWWPDGRDRSQLVIRSYNQLARPGATIPVGFDLCILDEAHYCKSPQAQRTKAAMVAALGAKRAWLLSGTPMPNNPAELFTVFDYLWPKSIPHNCLTYEDWRNHFCRWFPMKIGQYRTVPKIVGTKNGKQLREMVRGIMLRRHLADVNLQLPPLSLHVVPLPADVTFASELENLIEQGNIETPTVRRLLGEHKAPRVASLLAEENQWPVVVMYHHKQVAVDFLVKIRHEHRTIRVAGLDGSTTQKQRGERVQNFQDGKYDVFLVQQQAGGVAITLTRANSVVLLEPDWSPEVNAQAIKRVHRITQTRPTRARLFKVEGSIDEGIIETLARKIRMRKEILP